MSVIDVIALPPDDGDDNLWRAGPDRYDYSRLPPDLRDRAKLAQGTIVEGLSSAVRRVIESGQALSWAKAALPHGEYLPWVQMACGLKPRYAQMLIRAAEWTSNAQQAAHLDGITDTTTLFLLSADTTTEEVREWFMERCAAGDVPTRAEVQERKRAAGRARTPQPVEDLALSLIRKGDLSRVREALALADRAEMLTPEQVMAEQRLRELGRQRFIPGVDADFHRMKNGHWIRLPHGSATIDAKPMAPAMAKPPPRPAPPVSLLGEEVRIMRDAEVATLIDATGRQLATKKYLAKRNGDGSFVEKGWRIRGAGRGMSAVEPFPGRP